MSPAVALIAGLVVALLIAAISIAWIWKAQRARLETREGLAILSGMRWRELSNLVVDALAASGFERESPEQQARRGTAGEVHVYRDGRPWILTCRQGLSHVVTRASVEEFTRAFRTSQAVGGLVVTPGRVEPQARDAAGNVELVDGEELWKLVGPLLPPSVHAEVAARAHAQALRTTGTALAAATAVGLAVGFGLSQFADENIADSADVPAAVTRTSPPRVAATPTPAPAAPMSEDEEREAIVREIKELPGVERALWSTRSTLQVYLADPSVANDDAICSVMKRYELLRASRLQIQSPESSGRPVRFMQCAVY